MPSTPRVLRGIWTALAVSLALSAMLYVPLTWHWPLVGDASLIHYIAFLIGRGWAPYRQLGDMNMPGSFLIELAAMHVFGPGALAWRLFDSSLCLCGAGAMFAICTRRNWFPALFASSLFILIHGRDGLAQGGQRDLTMAVCLLASTACLLALARRRGVVAAAAIGFGLLAGVAATIKPTAVLLTAAQALLFWRAEDTAAASRRAVHGLSVAGAAWLVGPAVCFVFLVHERAIAAFLDGLHGIVPYYSSLGHRPASYVLVHSLSPIEPLVALWLLVLLLRPRGLGRGVGLQKQLLITGVLFGIANCVVQHRALPYYRYPLLAFLLPLIALDLIQTVEGWTGTEEQSPTEHGTGTRLRLSSSRAMARGTGGLAAAGLMYGGLFLAPQSAVLMHRYRWDQTDMLDSLQRTLDGLGGAALSGRVQCIDSVSGCGTVLYRMRLEPATGVLSDFLLFGNTTDVHLPEEIPVIRQTRAEFLSAVAARPPQVMIVTSHLHMTGPENYGKLERWPALEQLLATRYRLTREWRPARPERWWSREEYPAGYRVYVLRSEGEGVSAER